MTVSFLLYTPWLLSPCGQSLSAGLHNVMFSSTGYRVLETQQCCRTGFSFTAVWGGAPLGLVKAVIIHGVFNGFHMLVCVFRVRPGVFSSVLLSDDILSGYCGRRSWDPPPPLCWEPRADECSPIDVWSRWGCSHACFTQCRDCLPCPNFYFPVHLP